MRVSCFLISPWHITIFHTFVLRVWSSLLCPHGDVVRLTGESQSFCGDFWTGSKGPNWLLWSQIFTCMLPLPPLPLHSRMKNRCTPRLGVAIKSLQLLLLQLYSPTLIKWILFPQSCLGQYPTPQNPKLLLRNECRLFGLSPSQLWNAKQRRGALLAFMLPLSQDCNFKYLIIFLPWWVQRKTKGSN